MLDANGEKVIRFKLLLFAFQILKLHVDRLEALHLLVNSRHREAALFVCRGAGFTRDHGIDEDERIEV
jgi:hypothetical protein